MKKAAVLRNYYILPCCLLLLNLVNNIVSYKAGLIHDPFLRTGFIMFMVLAGSSIVALIVSPAIEAFVGWLHASSGQKAGKLGELLFLVGLGLIVFFLYYRSYIIGPQAILPDAWKNH